MTDIVAQSEDAIAQGSQSFAAAARLLPKSVRDDTVMLYAWCRYADDVIDGQELGHGTTPVPDPAARLDTLTQETLKALRTDTPVAAPYEALRMVAARHHMPEEWPLDLITGFEMDVKGQSYTTLDDTLQYCYHVAGVVGLMMARVMGAKPDSALDHACDLGLAFQLTNIARDVMDDARLGRSYLPRDWLGGTLPDPQAEIPSPEVYSAILRLLDTAEPYYASGFAGLKALPLRAAWSIAAAARIYRAIGTEIRKRGPEGYRNRISTTKLQKGLLVARSGMDLPFRQNKTASRAGLWNRPHYE